MAYAQGADPDNGVDVIYSDPLVIVDACSQTQTDNTGTVCNELLCYMQYHLKISAKNMVTDIVKRHFTHDEIVAAKMCLSEAYADSIARKLKNRRNTVNKKKADAIVDDIANVLVELDQKSLVTNFVSRDIGRLPRCDPTDIDSYAVVKRILDLEQRMQTAESNLGEARTASHEYGT